MEPFTIGTVRYAPQHGLSCEKCGGELCAWGANYKEHVKSRRATAAELQKRVSSSYYIKEHDDVELREFLCPHCGLLLDCEIYRVGEPDRADYVPLELARAGGYDARALFQEAPDTWITFQ
jgi:acetone carboxylase gamma subunit